MRSFVLVLAFTGLLICAPADAERFTSSELGLSIEKPHDWCVLSPSEVAADHRQFEADNPGLKQALERGSNAPRLAFFRCPKGAEGVTPTLKVDTQVVDSSAQGSGQRALELILPQLSKLIPNFTILTPPQTVNFAGKSAGYSAVAFTLKAGGKSYQVVAETWAVPRGADFLMVSATYPAGDRPTVMQIVNSLRFTR